MSSVYCVIMAGGKGERFWPCSREDTPKQLLNIVGNEPMIEQTVLRLTPLIPFQNILIITNAKLVDKMQVLLPQLPPENIIGEPCGKDTAPCVALAAGIIKAKAENEDPVMILLPADHCIHNVAKLQNDLKLCCQTATENNALVTIGIPPNAPSPDYGYIESEEQLAPALFKVKRFIEKPTQEKAVKLLESGNFKWNSGMFIWKVSTVLTIMQQHAPDLAQLAEKISSSWKNGSFDTVLPVEYDQCRKISIDYAIMEKADNIIMREASFDWDDVGNWISLRHHIQTDEQQNVAIGKFESLDTENCIVYSSDPDHLLCAIDMKNAVIVHTPDATLICSDKSTAKLKDFLKKLKEEKDMQRYL